MSHEVIIVEPDALHRQILEKLLEAHTYPVRVIAGISEHAGAQTRLISFANEQEGNAAIILTKPYRYGRLLDIIHQLSQSHSHDFIEIGNMRLDCTERLLSFPASQREAVKLTEKEQEILLCLHAQDGVIERQSLLEEIWGYGESIETHTLETHIYRLRQKLEDNPSEPRYLLTENDGYRLVK